MKFPFVFRSSYDYAMNGWGRCAERNAELRKEIHECDVIIMHKNVELAQLKNDYEAIWKLANKNANKPQRRDRNGKFAKSVSEF